MDGGDYSGEIRMMKEIHAATHERGIVAETFLRKQRK